jgi:cellulose synthase/poly-beta-1,6-N-acetylglucosamine synthase-like glycosyltransferase
MIVNILGFLYVLAAAALSVYGLMGLLTLGLYWRHRRDTTPSPPPPQMWPPVTVQLPVYNEQFVVERLIEAAVSLNYPHDKLQIQVVDDSTDETVTKTAHLVTSYQQQGINISHICRPHRQGFKAGALANALPTATGDYIAIFDADFQPQPDFLRQTVPHFITNPKLGLVQTRWGHLNPNDSALTAAQAIALDKHFVMEQTTRFRANLFPKFNGAGGIWRRACMEDAGGWQEDTVCEDLCLSTRAVLKGWQMQFLPQVVAPAELPASITAYKIQQGRWSKGSLQCFLKFGHDILAAPEQSWLARIYALLAMTAYLTQPLLLILLLLQIPLLALHYPFSSKMILISIAGVGQPILFVWGQQVLHRDWQWRLRHFPTLLFVSIGTAPSNSRAMWQAVFGRFHPFDRTPKGQHNYQLPFDGIVFVEIFFALYSAGGLIIAWLTGQYGFLFFLASCVIGFSYVAILGLRETIHLPKLLPKYSS